MRMNSRAIIAGSIVATTVVLAGCATPAQNPTNISRTAQGAAVGAATGALVGGGFAGIGAPIGLAVGGVGGAVTGALVDRYRGPESGYKQYPNVNFSFDRFNIAPTYNTELDHIGTILHNHPHMMVTLDGYTDSRGNQNYNIPLSQRRANSVSKYLKQHGASSSQIKTYAHGEVNPLADNKKPVGQHLNRRVEIRLQSQGAKAESQQHATTQSEKKGFFHNLFSSSK